MKKYALIILLTALALIFSACTGNTPPAETTAAETQPEDTAPPAPAELKFSEDGKCEFYIVYPEDFDSSVKDIALDLQKAVKKYTGVTPKILSDKIMEKPIDYYGVEYEYEILLGPTNREESQKVHSSMRSRDFGVSFDGTKLILAGTTVDTVDRAYERFLSSILMKQGRDDQGKATVTLTQDDVYSFVYKNYAVGSCTVLGSDISEFGIAYEQYGLYSAERNARLFEHYMYDKAGYVLELGHKIDDSSKQIIFKNVDASLPRHGYSVSAEDNKLYVSAECMEGYAAAYTYLCETLFKGEKVEIAEGFKYSGVADASEFPEMDKRSGEYRVIFNNIYGNHKAEHPVGPRNQMNGELHLEYLPDVIGVQEGSPNVDTYYKFMTSNGYTKLDSNPDNSNKHDYTSILYLADKLEVLEKGYHLYDDGAGDKSKSVTWAVFKDKASGDVFAVGSTHFYWTSDELGQAARLKDAAQVSEIAKTISEKYSCAFIVGGDFNCRIDSAPFGVLNGNGFKNLQKISSDTVDITTHHSYAAYDEALRLYLTPVYSSNPYSKAIDHALVYNEGKLTPKLFRVILHDYSYLSSDHCPVMVEFDVN